MTYVTYVAPGKMSGSVTRELAKLVAEAPTREIFPTFLFISYGLTLHRPNRLLYYLTAGGPMRNAQELLEGVLEDEDAYLNDAESETDEVVMGSGWRFSTGVWRDVFAAAIKWRKKHPPEPPAEG